MLTEPRSSVNWGLVCHVSGLAGYVVPFANLFAPLAIWLIRKDTDPAVKEAGREALNFNISFTLYGLIAGLLCYALIGYIALPLVLVTHVVLIIQATVKANKGQNVRYPFTLRFIN
jgi:uncharacterized protein